MLSENLTRSRLGAKGLPVDSQVYCALRYLATGANFSVIGDSLGLHKSTVSRTVSSVVEALCNKASSFIAFPDCPADLRKEALSFSGFANFPNIVGAIDGTLIRIKKPPAEREASFLSRKGFHAINVQVVCRASLQFSNVFAKFPGSSHDSFLWRVSELRNKFQSGEIQTFWLLGDSGYPLEPWLLTPLLNPASQPEIVYV